MSISEKIYLLTIINKTLFGTTFKAYMDNIKNDNYRVTSSVSECSRFQLCSHKRRALCLKAIRRHLSKARLLKVEQSEREVMDKKGGWGREGRVSSLRSEIVPHNPSSRCRADRSNSH